MGSSAFLRMILQYFSTTFTKDLPCVGRKRGTFSVSSPHFTFTVVLSSTCANSSSFTEMKLSGGRWGIFRVSTAFHLRFAGIPLTKLGVLMFLFTWACPKICTILLKGLISGRTLTVEDIAVLDDSWNSPCWT